jgi:hypothetical protein
MAQRTILCLVLVIGTFIGCSVAPRTFAAASNAATAVTANPVAYHITAQLVSGPTAGTTIQGQVSGMLNSTGLLTATLTLTNGMESTVKGTVSSAAHITVVGKAGNLTLTGKALNQKSGVWGGAVAQGMSMNAGIWTLTPETQAIIFALGGKSAMGSADKLSLAGELTLNLTADGWGDGTFAFLANDTVLPAVGQVSNGNMTATIFWPKKGAVMVVGTSKSVVGVLKWTGTFVGPATGDFGTFLGEG